MHDYTIVDQTFALLIINDRYAHLSELAKSEIIYSLENPRQGATSSVLKSGLPADEVKESRRAITYIKNKYRRMRSRTYVPPIYHASSSTRFGEPFIKPKGIPPEKELR